MKIFDQEIQVGKHNIIRIPAPKLYNIAPLVLPVHVVCGKKPGPILCVTAAVHGDEVNGVEITRRLLKKKLLPSLAGSLIVVPVVNIYGFLFQDRYLPDRRDLNRSFPGSEKGSLASRFAYLLTHAIFRKATHHIDLHSGSLRRSNLPQVRIDTDIPEVKSMARAFGAPLTLDAPNRAGSLREYARQQGNPYLLYEAGEAGRFDENSIRIGVNGILNVMQHLKMLPPKTTTKPKKNFHVAKSSYWVRSPFGGLFITKIELGKYVQKGEMLGIIVQPNDGEEHKIISPLTGIIIGRSDAPLIHEGAAIFHIACIEKKEHKPGKTPWIAELRNIDKEDDKLIETQLDG